MNLNNLTYKDFELQSFTEMKGLSSLLRSDISDYSFRQWNRTRTSNGKTYITGAHGVSVEIRPTTLAVNQGLIYAIEHCLDRHSEIWQSVVADRYLHSYINFYEQGCLIVLVSFAHNQSHRIESVRFLKNPDDIRKGTLYSIAAR